eukprot:TRINITY_DN5941_c0_g2_i3.p2 TRINITY_DN5941_c0_g2~~TRINITY_DN5941_c0_g2_i3.p2  ORF type:complete len:138 (+),score=25.93 TRINITY_DN5941_c0_g2_i3:73-486(+)
MCIRDRLDTICVIWDIEKEAVTTQLVAHDKEVFDIAFGHDSFTFATAGGDGSVRQFDTRNYDNCIIIYESQYQAPFIRLAWNRVNPNYLATFTADSCVVTIIDLRYPMQPFVELAGHIDSVNAIAWSPNSGYVFVAR